jgi:hypothetical protein
LWRYEPPLPWGPRNLCLTIDLIPQAAIAMSAKERTEDIPEIEVTPAMVEAAREAIEPFAFTSMDGYDMEKGASGSLQNDDYRIS